MDVDECYENQINQSNTFPFTSSQTSSYTICNDKIIINEYLELLDTISKNILDNLQHYDHAFIQSVKEKFVYYYRISETKTSLLNHPIHFMHLAFYEIYSSYFYNPICIHSFNKYFIKYQKFSEYKYNFIIIQLIDKIKNHQSIDNLAFEIENLMI